MSVTDVSEAMLEEHVRQSNSIEGIHVEPGHPLFDGHYHAAQLAASGECVHPNRLHHALVAPSPEMQPFAGKYRDRNVRVGETAMPDFRHVPELMQEWEDMQAQFLSSPHSTQPNDNFIPLAGCSSDAADGARFLHDWLLCIHPWRDGNGRTARLVLNMLRLQKGLPWHIVYATNVQRYHHAIHMLEASIFMKQHEGMYPM